jgi:hypothetical protein
MKTLTIGDIHGRDSWKSFTQDLDSYDKIIFIGDYVDSFTVSNVLMLHNLVEIIELKKQNPDKVVLLLGNHDIQYIVPNQSCSGYRPEMQYDLQDLFRKNLDLFQMAYQYENTLWTHAGVSEGWLKQLERLLANPTFKYSDIVAERNPETLADKINLAWELKLSVLYYVDTYSGGTNAWAGPLWVRPIILNNWPIKMNQVVGHTPQATIWTNPVEGNVTHYFIDCLEYGEEKPLVLEL